jgi:hypothetical protein
MGSNLFKQPTGDSGTRKEKSSIAAEYVSGLEGTVGPVPGKLEAHDGILRFRGVLMTAALTSRPLDIDLDLAAVVAVTTAPGAGASDKHKTQALQVAVNEAAGLRTYIFAVEPQDAALAAHLARSVVGHVPEVAHLTAAHATQGTEELLRTLIAAVERQTSVLEEIRAEFDGRRP